MPEHNDIEIRSDEVQEILTRVPSWMIRWGITLIFAIIMVCITLSYFIKYPDVIKGSLTLTTETPPAKLVPKTNGEIEKLFVVDNVDVKEGDVIAQIRNPLSKEAILYLEQKVAEVEDGLLNEFSEPIAFEESDLVFGGVQNDYNALVTAISDYRFSLNVTQYNKRRGILQKQISNYRKLGQITDRQLDDAEQNHKLAEDKYQSNKKLYEQGVISKVEFYDQEILLSTSKNNIENLNKTKVQNAITLTDYERQLNELEIDFLSKKISLTKGIESSLKNIRNEINNWEETYLLVAPMDGKLTYISQLSENQFVQAGEPLFAVVPNDKDDYIGYIAVDKLGYGKVEVGQDVKIKFDNFPSAEFGQVKGRVEGIAIVPNEEKYQVKVRLTEGLTTTYKKELVYTPEMSGQADIVTEDLRILERIFNQFRELFDE